MHARHAGSMPSDAAVIAAMQRHVPVSVSANHELIERDAEGPWVMGERYTICDPYLFTLAQWLETDGVEPARIPKVIDHRRRMSERATVKKAPPTSSVLRRAARRHVAEDAVAEDQRVWAPPPRWARKVANSR